MRCYVYSMALTILLFSSWSLAAQQTFNLNISELKVSGTFPLNTKKPVVVSGFDEANKPYRVEVLTQKQGKGLYNVSYSFFRNEKKERGGSIVIQAGQKGAIGQQAEGDSSSDGNFQMLITE